MNQKILYSSYCFVLIAFSSFAQSLHEKYPKLLRNEDKGILTEFDLLAGEKKPMDPNLSKYYEWECFLIKDIHLQYRTWRDSDSMGPSNIIVTMCDFEIWNKNIEPAYSYGSRRAKEVSYCNDFKKAWKKITQKEEFVCIKGEPLPKIEEEKVDGKIRKVKSFIWDIVKTKKGCHSYFGDCYIQNLKK